MIESHKVEYYKLRVKAQTYIGRPVVAVYVQNRTKKVKEKLYNLLRREEVHSKQQAENFTSVITHEMRTPILTIIFFLQRVISMLGAEELDKSMIEQCKRYCAMTLNQLEFLNSFVVDLLDLGMLKNGTFTLVKDSFDITGVVKLIMMMFGP